MRSLKKYIAAGLKYLINPDYRFIIDSARGRYNDMPDKEFLLRRFKAAIGKNLDLDNPKTFNEKLQWIKLYDRKPEYTTMVDKYLVREYVAGTIGEKYLIPSLGVWDDPEKIDFDKLPDRFVLKCNHNSGLGMCLCKDKSKLDFNKVKAGLKKGLEQDYYLYGREWPYKHVKRRIVGEEYLPNELSENKELNDYKVLCFNGQPRLIEIHMGRFGKNHTQDIYDENWNKTEIDQPGSPISDIVLDKPEFFDEMMELSRKLSSGIPHVRVDWYYTKGQLYFGELTFFDGSGFIPFNKDYDLKIGEMLNLPIK